MPTLADTEKALDNEGVIVRVGRNWWLAQRAAKTNDFGNGEWLIRVIAGPHKARGYIGSDAAGSREFKIVRTPS